MMTHTLVTSVRRRRDLAMLKTLGFVRGQVVAAMVWQATTFAVVALALGRPLGLAAGRWPWELTAAPPPRSA
jgi:ABC-type lipoprotein release transport system permease subunit